VAERTDVRRRHPLREPLTGRQRDWGCDGDSAH